MPQLGAAALANLRPLASLEAFEAALGASLADASTAGELPLRMQPLPGRQRHQAQSPHSLPQWAQALCLGELAQRLAGHTLWWPDPAAAQEHTLSIAPGLPPAELFVELLQGSW